MRQPGQPSAVISNGASDEVRHPAEPPEEPPAIHIVYRSYGGENMKGRPPYYSKLLALVSMLRAVSENGGARYDITYVNDGPIPPDRARIMAASGNVVGLRDLGAAGSMRAALNIASERPWGDREIVWFAEEDHLYKPSAFSALGQAAVAFPDADYFALYASIGSRAPDGRQQPDYAHVPKAWTDAHRRLVAGHPWSRALSTTSTFGGRVQAVVEDRRMMLTAMRSGGAWDHTTCLMYQGYLPFSWTSLRDHFGSSASWKRKALSIAMRGSVNVWQLTRFLSGVPSRLLVAADPALETHLETDHLAIGTDWADVAKDCLAWAFDHGLLFSLISWIGDLALMVAGHSPTGAGRL